MTTSSGIREHMPVICADGKNHGEVDRVEGDSIKPARDGMDSTAGYPWTAWIMSISTFTSSSITSRFTSRCRPQTRTANRGKCWKCASSVR
ncbi:hypothetical protein SAMN00790413_06705 [Deinococcus hopiensis KR-140]|uniref:Uncharacterized protein n=1 Tax=Deinococcus hopiensis KR-140 TaxID=695939 RepID=A0A1W1UBW0_9DEIO|nr:hypothetical protein SAMN00790413_06705 [Deinococcus hopiensis KR-140]